MIGFNLFKIGKEGISMIIKNFTLLLKVFRDEFLVSLEFNSVAG